MTADEFKDWLVAHSYSQATFAAHIEMSREQVNRWCSGKVAVPKLLELYLSRYDGTAQPVAVAAPANTDALLQEEIRKRAEYLLSEVTPSPKDSPNVIASKKEELKKAILGHPFWMPEE